ncbi:hypothetical protein [Oscillibacter sp.]|uniref:flavodoxin family protein n=1 Tax=Oscillibacter sp. TaxID=1945593 RepID=UPI00289D94D5|nr:hypothetical protein [Oscillibacter sp.]
MSDILCMYYSRTGNTKTAMQELAAALDAELVELKDGVNRSGVTGFLRSGMDAMRRTVETLQPIETEKPLTNYKLVILGTPVWAGRCSSAVRSFLQEQGHLLTDVSYVLLRGGNAKYEEIYDQMDKYLSQPHQTAVSLRAGSVGYHFWQEEFLRRTRAFLEGRESQN